MMLPQHPRNLKAALLWLILLVQLPVRVSSFSVVPSGRRILVETSEAWLRRFVRSSSTRVVPRISIRENDQEAEDEDAGPKLDRKKKAYEFFADPYFYGGFEEVVKLFEPKRRQAFGEKTVEDFLRPIPKTDSLSEEFDRAGISSFKVKPYWEEISVQENDQEAEDEDAGPKLDRKEKAYEFFADPYFYGGKEIVVNSYEQDRRQAFEEKTVEDLLRPIPNTDSLSDAFKVACINSSFVKPYWEEIRKKMEDVLHNQLIVMAGQEACKDVQK